VKQDDRSQMTNGQRSLWTFLFFTLVAPFMAAIAVFLLASLVVILAAGMPGTFGGGVTQPSSVPTSTFSPGPGGLALQTFAIGSFVAGMAGAALAATVSVRGTIRWLEAAIAGVASFMIVAMTSGAVSSSLLTAWAFLAAVVAVLCRALLVRIAILPQD
jgi:hypothetical protein